MSETPETIEQRAQRIVQQEVLVCVSSLVHTLAQSEGGVEMGYQDLAGLTAQAAELFSGPIDYDECAIQSCWELNADGEWQSEDSDDRYNDSETLCSEECLDYDDYRREVFEHWAVSNWLAGKLEEQGETVDRDFAGLTVWARTTTGQAIYMDGVILQIAANLLQS